MTIQQLQGCTAKEIEDMSDAQLLKYFEPYLDITRPDRAVVANARKTGERRSKIAGPKSAGRAMAEQFMMQQFGININE